MAFSCDEGSFLILLGVTELQLPKIVFLFENLFAAKAAGRDFF